LSNNSLYILKGNIVENFLVTMVWAEIAI